MKCSLDAPHTNVFSRCGLMRRTVFLECKLNKYYMKCQQNAPHANVFSHCSLMRRTVFWKVRNK